MRIHGFGFIPMLSSSSLIKALLSVSISIILVAGCKTSVDAAAAASQLDSTSQDLNAYYLAMSQVIANSMEWSSLQSTLLGTQYGPEDIALYQTTVSELQKRSEMAKHLQELSKAFSQLTGSESATGISTAASNLATELVSIKALPSGPPVPDIFGQAGKELVTLVQEHQEKKAAGILDHTTAAISTLFSSEKPVYESLYSTYFALAQSLAKESIKRNWVDSSGLLQPALKPFGLNSSPSGMVEINSALRGYEQKTLAFQADSHRAMQSAATDGMAEALQEMSKRIHVLASEKSMLSRGKPTSLSGVEKWLLNVV